MTPIRQALRGVKYKLFPPRCNLNSELAKAREAHGRDLEVVEDMDETQRAYLTGIPALPDPLTDGIEVEEQFIEDGGSN